MIRPWKRRPAETLTPGPGAGAGRLADAEAEVELSRQRLAEAHEQVVKPLQAYAARNHFAELIAQSLARGRRDGNREAAG